jgi:hypothetical protein
MCLDAVALNLEDATSKAVLVLRSSVAFLLLLRTLGVPRIHINPVQESSYAPGERFATDMKPSVLKSNYQRDATKQSSAHLLCPPAKYRGS